MINFFDVATDEEIIRIMGESGVMEKSWWRETFADERAHDSNCANLYYLYRGRGDMETAEMYLDMIKDPDYKLQTTMLISECQIDGM